MSIIVYGYSICLIQWISAVLEEPLPEGDYADILKNGVILCRLINKIAPNSIPKFKEKVL